MSYLPDEPSEQDISDKLKAVEKAATATKSYFTTKETSCHCGCGLDIKPEMLLQLNKLRADYGKSINLTCGARCPTHNALVKGAKNSAHISGEAVDMVRTPELLKFVMASLEKYDIYMEHLDSTPTWIHIQTRKAVNRVFKP